MRCSVVTLVYCVLGLVILCVATEDASQEAGEHSEETTAGVLCGMLVEHGLFY